jgi:hypothetical protein
MQKPRTVQKLEPRFRPEFCTGICARTSCFLLAIRVRIDFLEKLRFPLVKRLFFET